MTRRPRIDLRSRQAFQAGVIDMVNRDPAALDTTIRRHACPLCRGAVYAPADSHLERIDCSSCGAVLLTRRAIGEDTCVVELDVGVPAPELARVEGALAQLGAELEPPSSWEAGVLAAVRKERDS